MRPVTPSASKARAASCSGSWLEQQMTTPLYETDQRSGRESGSM
jgi:hypothetical protein